VSIREQPEQRRADAARSELEMVAASTSADAAA
jgi:hypothetical protein